tara:strand:+ start:640 stop:1734 length:1095 start_codon:yes stop_codon:yes gene_type:complete
MKRTISIILLLLSIKAFSQIERITEFYPLTPIDTINNFNQLNKFERIDNLNSTDFFFTYKDRGYKSGLLLYKKSDDKWIIYELNSEMFSSSNMTIDNFRLEDEKYIFIQVSRFPSGVCSNIYGFLTILNIETCKTIEFCNYNQQECYDKNARVSSQSECRTTTNLEKGILSLKSSENLDGLNCIESAVYKIKNDSLIKIKYYLSTHKSFYPIVCNDEYDICTGTNFNSLKNKFSNAKYKEVPIFEYGYDSETIGKELYINNELQLFVAISDSDIITGISFVSPRYTFNNISTETIVSEILNKYPNSKLNIDLISDWEYIFIKELDIRLVFKTNNYNRIGLYSTDFEEGTTKVKRPNVTIDFIQI